MKRFLLISCCLMAIFAHAQTNVITYATGMDISFETIYHQWFDGTITAIRHDSIFVNDYAFHYKEIATIKKGQERSKSKEYGDFLMVAGGGVLLLGAVNGAYRGDKAKDWYTSGSFITAGAFLLSGFLLTRIRDKQYHIGKKYTLEYLALDLDKK